MNISAFLSAAMIAGTSLVTAAQADEFPARPVHVVIGFEAGGTIDVLARMISKPLAQKWGLPLIVDNKPGADGTIAADIVAHAPPDGYTILWTPNAHTITPNEYKLNYDPIKSFAPISEVGYVPDVLVINPSLPVNSLRELIALAKSKPGQLNYGSSGSGTSLYLEMEYLKKLAGINVVNVNYKGSAPAMVGLLGNEVQLMFGSIAGAAPHVKSGKLKALAVSTAARSPVLPDVPTVAEAANLQFDASTWNGLLAPTGTPPAIVNRLRDDILAALHTPEIEKTAQEKGLVMVGSSQEQFAKLIASDLTKWGDILSHVAK